MIQSVLHLARLDTSSPEEDEVPSTSASFDPSKVDGAAFVRLLEEIKIKATDAKQTCATLVEEKEALQAQCKAMETERDEVKEEMIQLRRQVRQSEGKQDLIQKEVDFLQKQVVQENTFILIMSSSSDAMRLGLSGRGIENVGG